MHDIIAPSELAFAVSNEASAARAILHSVSESCADDDEAKQLIIEGETNLMEAITAAVEREAVIKALSEALTTRISDMQARKSRMDDGRLRIREAIRSAMEVVGVPSRIELPTATIALRTMPQAVEIIDDTMLPETYLQHVVKVDR